MASLPYPLNGQNFMAERVWQGCHTLLQIAAICFFITPFSYIGGEDAPSPSYCLNFYNI